MIKFVADKLTIRGPKVDGGYTISFDVGEYEQDKIAQLVKISQQAILEVEVTYDRQTKQN